MLDQDQVVERDVIVRLQIIVGDGQEAFPPEREREIEGNSLIPTPSSEEGTKANPSKVY